MQLTENGKRIAFDRALPSDSGKYTCFAENIEGVDTLDTLVTIFGKLFLKKNKRNYNKLVNRSTQNNETISISCHDTRRIPPSIEL